MGNFDIMSTQVGENITPFYSPDPTTPTVLAGWNYIEALRLLEMSLISLWKGINNGIQIYLSNLNQPPILTLPCLIFVFALTVEDFLLFPR